MSIQILGIPPSALTALLNRQIQSTAGESPRQRRIRERGLDTPEARLREARKMDKYLLQSAQPLGDPQKLADQTIKAIRQYVAKLKPLPQAQYCAAGRIGVDPPWQPVPQQDPYLPNVNQVFPNIRPLVPPLLDERPRLFEIPWGGILTALATGVGVPVAVAVGVWLLYYIRAQRKAAGQPLLLDDERFQQLIDLLQSLGESQKKSSTTRSARK